MVTFTTLFLGLVLGLQNIALQVTEPVARVEVSLDGEPALVLEGPPWQGAIDLGRDLLPHELLAVGYDQHGLEVDRDTRWVNLPRQPAEVSIVLERDPTGIAHRARVSWQSLVDDQPSVLQADFDGAPLAFEDPHLIPLPPHDPDLLHFLRVEIEFGDIVRASSEITFGGTYLDQVSSDLTAVPVELPSDRRSPGLSTIQGWLAAREMTLNVAAVEKGQAEIIVVRDQGAWTLLRQVNFEARHDRLASQSEMIQGRGDRRQWFQPFEPGWDRWTYLFLWPVPSRRVVGESPYDLFTHSQKYAGDSGSLHGWLTTLEQPEETRGEQRLADAVAVAAVTAAGGNRRRGILLVLGNQIEDVSESSPAVVRRYLAALGVPLFVWSPDPTTPRQSPWGTVVHVTTPSLMARASGEIFHRLERQRIVWVEGRHLPHQISLTRAARRLRLLARTGDSEGDG